MAVTGSSPVSHTERALATQALGIKYAQRRNRRLQGRKTWNGAEAPGRSARNLKEDEPRGRMGDNGNNERAVNVTGVCICVPIWDVKMILFVRMLIISVRTVTPPSEGTVNLPDAIFPVLKMEPRQATVVVTVGTS